MSQTFVYSQLLYFKCYFLKTLHYVLKRSFNSDCHQFYQYKQNEQSPLILTELTEHEDHNI